MFDQVGSVQVKLTPEVWFINRELSFKPLHFVRANTPASPDAIKWIKSSLVGRFFLEKQIEDYFEQGLHVLYPFPSFEDPAEATLYELKWS